ncbi:hypothetical protein AFSV47Ss_0187 [African swine fever virus]|uniref:Uncharacterized protein n=1 Tax=African swine fever virus TaxID=10497 RepID=A0A6G6AHF9_ASF|nr:hypothetical protein AFSV47Ss_0187 [African swine fever virus]
MVSKCIKTTITLFMSSLVKLSLNWMNNNVSQYFWGILIRNSISCKSTIRPTFILNLVKIFFCSSSARRPTLNKI